MRQLWFKLFFICCDCVFVVTLLILFLFCCQGYPDDDLAPESCLRIVASLRPLARTKLKALRLLPHLSSHFRISEQDQIEIVGK